MPSTLVLLVSIGYKISIYHFLVTLIVDTALSTVLTGHALIVWEKLESLGSNLLQFTVMWQCLTVSRWKKCFKKTTIISHFRWKFFGQGLGTDPTILIGSIPHIILAKYIWHFPSNFNQRLPLEDLYCVIKRNNSSSTAKRVALLGWWQRKQQQQTYVGSFQSNNNKRKSIWVESGGIDRFDIQHYLSSLRSLSNARGQTLIVVVSKQWYRETLTTTVELLVKLVPSLTET